MNISLRKIINFRLIYIYVGLNVLFGCVSNELKLPPPTKYSPKIEETGKASFPLLKKEIDNIINKVEIHIDPKTSKTENEVNKALTECVEFLIRTFGFPAYKGKIYLTVTSMPLFRGRTTWKLSSDESRKIQVSDFSLYKKEKRILVHELFHVLYQSKQLVINSPEFVIEGLASYAEYKYIYPDKNHKFIYDELRQREKYFRCENSAFPIDYDSPFDRYGECMINKIYLQSAMLFFVQEENRSYRIISNILKKSPDEKLNFNKWAKNYSLQVSGIFEIL